MSDCKNKDSQIQVSQVEQAGQPEAQEALDLRRGGRFVATLSIDGIFDRAQWAQALTLVNMSQSILAFPYSVEEGEDTVELVLLGEVTGRGGLVPDDGPNNRRGSANVTTADVAAFLAEELGNECNVVPLEPSRDTPELLDLLRAYGIVHRRIREKTHGYMEIEPHDFVSPEIQERALSGNGDIEDGYNVKRYFKAVCSLSKPVDLDHLAACLNVVNEQDRMQVLPYYTEEKDQGSQLVLLGQARRRGHMGLGAGNVDAIAEQLGNALGCSVEVKALYPSGNNPDHVRLQRAFDALISSCRRRPYELGRAPRITEKSFVSKEERERREACEELLADQEGTLFTGTLTFPAGTDMSLVARANGIMRIERGLRVAPLGSSVADDGTRQVKVAGLHAGFFGTAPIRYDDVRDMESALGCVADVRMISGTMENPADLDLYAEAREVLTDPHAVTSVAAWIRSVEETSQDSGVLASRLVGVASVMERIDEMVSYAVHYKKTYGELPQLHAVFSGNAGTGKTTVARILAKKLGEAGVLDRSDRFVETDRSGLVGLFVGHTAAKTHACIDRAIGGVLFIDEAYSLNAGHERDYGREAVDALVKRLEDDSNCFVCILAGYPNPMDEMLSMNPGLRSRLPFRIEFPDYATNDLMAIFDVMLDEKFSITPAARSDVAAFMERARAAKALDFANARTVRNVVQRLQMRQLMKCDHTRIGQEVVASVLGEADMAALVGKGETRLIGFVAS